MRNHGTISCYQYELRHGIPTCKECKEASKLTKRDYRDRKRRGLVCSRG